MEESTATTKAGEMGDSAHWDSETSTPEADLSRVQLDYSTDSCVESEDSDAGLNNSNHVGNGYTQPDTNDDCAPCSDDPDFFEDPLPPLPPDGGWGWVIAFSSFLINAVVDGIAYAFGVLYVDLMDYFDSTPATTTWVGTLLPGIYLMTGPVVSALANKFGCRAVTISGSLLSAFFFFISTFATRVEVLIFTYGIMGGIGFGLMYLPAVCFVSYYFDKKRALATGIAVCGSGVGTFIMPLLYKYGLDNYGWRGTLWIVSGILLNCSVCGALFRPLSPSKPKRTKPKKEKKAKKYKKNKNVTRTPEIKRGTIMNKIIEQKKRIRTISTHSLDGQIITTDNKLVCDADLLQSILQGEKREPTLNGSMPNLAHKDSAEAQPPEENGTHLNEPKSASWRKGSAQSTGPILVNKQLERVKHGNGNVGPVRKRLISTQSSAHDSSDNMHRSNASMSDRQKDVSRVMYRKDIFYTGSVTSIAEYKSNPDMVSYVASITSIPDANTGRCGPCVSVMKTILDFNLFKSATFALLCLNAFLSFLGFYTPFMYLTHYAIDMGVDRGRAVFLVSIIGICNTVGRVAAGWLADRPWADSLVITIVSLVIAGVATAVMPFITNYVLLALMAAVFGCCVGAFIALRSIVTAEMIGVHRLTNAFGLVILFQGLAGIMGAPLAAIIYTQTGSYVISFIISGVMLLLSGIVCIPARKVAQWEKNGEEGYDMVGSQYSRVIGDVEMQDYNDSCDA